MHRRHVHVLGWGHALPRRRVTNAELTDFLDTSDDWIASRTGIRERRIATDDENTSGLGARAAQRALVEAGLDAADVDALLCATSTPDCLTPATACLIQQAIGAHRAFAFDVGAGCSGFLFALRAARALIRDGAAETVVVVGAETMSRVVDWSDRNTCVLFGDGAGAVVLHGAEDPGGVGHCRLGSDGAGASMITIGIGTRSRHLACAGAAIQPHVEMQGAKVYAFAARKLSENLAEILDETGLRVEDVDLLVPHQANLRIIESATRRLGFPARRVFNNLDRYANTAAASIPIALSEAAQQGRIRRGDHVLLAAVGSGLSWAATHLEWTAASRARAIALQPPRRTRHDQERDARLISTR